MGNSTSKEQVDLNSVIKEFLRSEQTGKIFSSIQKKLQKDKVTIKSRVRLEPNKIKTLSAGIVEKAFSQGVGMDFASSLFLPIIQSYSSGKKNAQTLESLKMFLNGASSPKVAEFKALKQLEESVPELIPQENSRVLPKPVDSFDRSLSLNKTTITSNTRKVKLPRKNPQHPPVVRIKLNLKDLIKQNVAENVAGARSSRSGQRSRRNERTVADVSKLNCSTVNVQDNSFIELVDELSQIKSRSKTPRSKARQGAWLRPLQTLTDEEKILEK